MDRLDAIRRGNLTARAWDAERLSTILANLVAKSSGQFYTFTDGTNHLTLTARQLLDVLSFNGAVRDDGQEFELTGWAGGAAPGGEFSTLTCELRKPGQPVQVLHYRRDTSWEQTMAECVPGGGFPPL